MLGEKILHLVDNLSRTLQHKDLSASEGQAAARLTPSALRNDGKFDEFWQKVCDKANEFDVNELALPWRRKVPRRYEIGDGDGDHPSTPKQHYLTVYFESLDLIKACIVE